LIHVDRLSFAYAGSDHPAVRDVESNLTTSFLWPVRTTSSRGEGGVGVGAIRSSALSVPNGLLNKVWQVDCLCLGLERE
jgi:hypothetical protein